MKTKIIIDCDPGQDDAVMLMLAFGNRDKLDILGITTVAGNVGAQKTERNARIICELTGNVDIGVYHGCETPLEGALRTAAEVHGVEGMNGTKIYEPKMRVQCEHAVQFLINALRAEPSQTITLALTAPMTNIARALMEAPDIAPRIKEIVLMGGARCEGGNVTPSAEYNIFADPHAADIVYKSGVPITTIGLDVTHKVISNPKRLARMKAIGNAISDTAWSILGPNSFYDQDIYFTDGAPLHDPCVIAYILAPELFEAKFCNLRVELKGDHTMGHTSVDFWNRTKFPKNTHWVYKADVDGIYDLLFNALGKYS